jgi:hypothetical protein
VTSLLVGQQGSGASARARLARPAPVARPPAHHAPAPPGLDRLAPVEAARWRRRLDSTARPCGCKSGAALTLAALVGWPVWVVLSEPPHTPARIGLAVVVYALVVVGSGMVGKVAGIVVGRLRHRRFRRQLAQRLALLGPVSDG